MDPQFAQKIPLIQQLCRETHLRYLWVFGSVVSSDFRSDSDIDFLFEFQPEAYRTRLYYEELMQMIDDIQQLLGRKVDFVDYSFLSNPFLKAELDQHKQLIYAAQPAEISV